MQSWKELVRLVNGRPFSVRKIRIPSQEIEIEGDFSPPPLALLPMDDQVFAAAFIASHGSIKKMEELFNISYPSVKNRLNRIAEKLDFVDIKIEHSPDTKRRTGVLARLEAGEITVADALEALR